MMAPHNIIISLSLSDAQTIVAASHWQQHAEPAPSPTSMEENQEEKTHLIKLHALQWRNLSVSRASFNQANLASYMN
jgi:hypothetical protein